MRRSALPHAKHVVAALASSSPAVKRWEISSSASSGGGVAAEAELTLAANETVSVYTAFADNALSDSNAAGAAAVTAAASLAAATAARSSAGTAAAVADASRQFWSEFWNRSAISLPSSPSVERYWYDARYITGSMAPTDPRLPPPGLFGPWVSKDGPAFGGDYTLDYNYVRAKRSYFVYFVDFWKNDHLPRQARDRNTRNLHQKRDRFATLTHCYCCRRPHSTVSLGVTTRRKQRVTLGRSLPINPSPRS